MKKRKPKFRIGVKYLWLGHSKRVYKCVRDSHKWDRTKRLEWKCKFGTMSVHISQVDRSEFREVR